MRFHRDDYSAFRQHLKNALLSGKRKRIVFALTVHDLKDQWDRQNGTCPFTGWSLINIPALCVPTPLTPDRASLDRIDPAKGYVVGNIRFIAYIANIARHRFSDDQLIAFCAAVSSTHYKGQIQCDCLPETVRSSPELRARGLTTARDVPMRSRRGT